MVYFWYRRAFISKKKIVFLEDDRSGSNSRALFNYFSKDSRFAGFELVLLRDQSLVSVRQQLSFLQNIFNARVIFTTHQSVRLNLRQIHVQLWHGFVIKNNGVMFSLERGSGKFRGVPDWRRATYILSYSGTNTALLNACMVTDPAKYVITGAPRNDLFFDGGRQFRRSRFECLFGFDSQTKVVVVALTYENGMSSVVELVTALNRALFVEHNLFFLVKVHPALLPKTPFESGDERIRIVSQASPELCDLDLYELLDVSFCLITDASSVFIDYLLLNRPIIFFTQDRAAGLADRGFLIDNLNDFLPGERTSTAAELNLAIERISRGDDKFSRHRSNFRKICFRHEDGQASSRWADFISRQLN